MSNQLFKELFMEQSPCYHPNVKQMNTTFNLPDSDHEVLKALATQVAEIAQRSEMSEKKKLWTLQNDLKTNQPLVFADPEVGWNEIILADSLKCKNPLARTWEMTLRKQVYWGNEIKDDKVIEATFDVPFSFSDDGWGVGIKRSGTDNVANGGAFHTESAIKDYEEDFEKLHFPQITIDEEQSESLMELAKSLFDGTLSVRRRMIWHWDVSYVEQFVLLRGMEDFMCDFIEEPEYIHKMMRMITDGMNKRLDWMEEKGLLTLNTDGSYIGTGGQGFTSQLPRKNFDGLVTTMDMWGAVQAQETVSVNPEMYGEFILPYQIEILNRFGLSCYGCCEPFDPRWKHIKKLPRLRRVSVSPWANYNKVPEFLGKDYVALVKLIPTPLASSIMDEEVVRADCRHAAEASKGGICEFIMKDNHTLGGNPRNITRWVEIMREEISRVYG